MKNRNEIEVPDKYFERHPLVLIIWIILTFFFVGSVLYLFLYEEFEMHGWALIMIPPALYTTFQTLVLILNPFALVFKDKLEIKRHLFYNKFWYFNDIQKVSEVSNGSFKITYNDGDEEELNLRGIRPSHIQPLRDELHKQVYLSLEKRDRLN